MQDFGLYLIITNPTLPYEEIAKIAVKHKIKFLQLREKNLSDQEQLEILEKLNKIAKNSNTKIVMNDRADLASISGVPALHLGQKDLKKAQAQNFFKDGIIGLSTHSLKQAKKAISEKPDYIGFGPIYKTPTKKNPDPVVGTKLLKKVIEISDIPVVAIGGIDETNIEEVLRAGAKNVCLVRYFMNSKDLEDRILKIKKILKKFK